MAFAQIYLIMLNIVPFTSGFVDTHRPLPQNGETDNLKSSKRVGAFILCPYRCAETSWRSQTTTDPLSVEQFPLVDILSEPQTSESWRQKCPPTSSVCFGGTRVKCQVLPGYYKNIDDAIFVCFCKGIAKRFSSLVMCLIIHKNARINCCRICVVLT